MRENAKKQQLDFPIVIDNDKATWNAWGNSMWPSVYLIDKQGYLRSWWYGEMDWKGLDGHKQMKKRIAELLAE